MYNSLAKATTRLNVMPAASVYEQRLRLLDHLLGQGEEAVCEEGAGEERHDAHPPATYGRVTIAAALAQ
jgi:hypothetical protein